MKFRVMITAVISLALTGETIAKPVLANVAKKPIPAKTVVKPPLKDHMPIRIGMTFAQIRAATPSVVWKMTPLEKYAGRSFVRVLAAPTAAALDGLPLDVIAVRGPSDTLFAQHFVSRPMGMSKGDCFARFRRFSDAVGRQTGVDVKAWLPQITSAYFDQTASGGFVEPRSDDLADQLIINPSQSGFNSALPGRYFFPSREDSRTFSFLIPEYPTLSTSELYFEKKTISLGWFGHFEQANVRWTVTAIFERDEPLSLNNRVSFENPAETPGKCRMSLVSKTGNPSQSGASDNNQSAPPYPLYTRDQLRDGGWLANRYYALSRRGFTARTDDEAGIYLCSASLRDGGLRRCEAEKPKPMLPEGQLGPFAPLFLSGFAAPATPINEDDFAPRFVRVQFGFRLEDKLPEFDWSKAEAGNPITVQLTQNLYISDDDYPPSAMRDEIDADVNMDCLVLNDLSIYCGRVIALVIPKQVIPEQAIPKRPMSKKLDRKIAQNYEKLFADEVSRIIFRRMRSINTYSQKADGSDPRGTYFRRIIKFRVAK